MARIRLPAIRDRLTDRLQRPLRDLRITKVKLYSALDALRLLAKHHALLTEVLAVKDLPKDERELRMT